MSDLYAGGPAKFLAVADSASNLSALCKWASSMGEKALVLGKGSNCLFDDRGFDGLVIVNQVQPFVEDLGDGLYRVGAGRPFNRLGMEMSARGLGGLEFAAGIPGSVGGAVYMNAGSGQQDTASVAVSAEVMRRDGTTEHWDLRPGTAMGRHFGYRRSPFQEHAGDAVVVSVTFRLRPDDSALGRARAGLARRRATQPLEERSAGSVFRNPGGGLPPAGQLIDEAGLRGTAVGRAAVSLRHANFLVNLGGATSAEMRELMSLVKAEVWHAHGVALEEEICVIPHSGSDGGRRGYRGIEALPRRAASWHFRD